MIRLMIGIIFVLVTAWPLEAVQTYKNIVVISFINQQDADDALENMKDLLENDTEISALKEERKFNYISRLSGKYFIVSIEPFRNDKVMYKVLNRVQVKYSDAFVYTHWGDDEIETPKTMEKEVVFIEKIRTIEVPKIVEKEIIVIEKVEENNLLLWFGFFALALLGLILIFRSSRQSKTIVDTRLQMKHSMKNSENLMVNVSEKIQDPVHEIIERSKKIISGGLSEGQTNELKNLQYSDELLLDITNDLIDFLKLQSGKLEIQNAAFNINNVLDEVAGMVSSRARGSNIEFIFDIEKDVPSKVIGDPLRLSQLLTNLLSNAMKFTDKGEVRLNVMRLEDSKSHVNLRFDVIDTGIGIKEERIDDIFVPFSSANDKSQTGMGLFISRKLAQLMGGDIQVESTVNKGTTFIVTIALSMENLNEKRHYRLPSKAYTGHSILIVDDNKHAAEALQKMLQYFRHDVEIKTSAQINAKMSLLGSSEIIVVAEELLLPSIIDAIKGFKEKDPNIKLVAVGSMLFMNRAKNRNSDVIDRTVMKPFSQQRVMELVISLFTDTATTDEVKKTESIVINQINKADSAEVDKTKVFEKVVPEQEIIIYEDIPVTPNITRDNFKVFSGASILIAEDNLINQKVLTGLLGASGITMTIAGDGQEALEKLAKLKEVDLVLMDINMPVMDGYEATRKIRENSEHNRIPVVSLTGLGLPEEIQKMYEFGMNAHLIKPLQVVRFIRFLHVILSLLKQMSILKFRRKNYLSLK
ncbi:MAG: hypothetical protein DRG24_01475 [Epsilonproteobacteria bacterium]|nr:MAG: hypothetical protein DRG24_01475 [Campylobacterota bacterium]